MNTSVATNSPAFASNPLDVKADYGRASFDVTHAAVINATYELAVRPRTLGQQQRLGAESDRWLAGQRHPDAAIGRAVHAAAFLQPVERWRHAQSGAAFDQSELHRLALSKTTIPINTSIRWRSFSRCPGTYGNAGRNTLRGPRLITTDLSFAKGFHVDRAAEPEIPRGIFQSVQSHQFEHAESGGLRRGDRRSIADRGRDHLDGDDFAADSAGIEAGLVKELQGLAVLTTQGVSMSYASGISFDESAIAAAACRSRRKRLLRGA